MRTLSIFLIALICAGCQSAQRANPTAALAQSGYMPTARAAVDGSPGITGPQELLAVYVPLGPFAIKGGLVWDGQPWTWTPPAAQAASAPCAAVYPTSDPCAPAVAPTGQWVWVQE